MRSFIIGMIFGVIVTTVGFSGIARMFDNGIAKVQTLSEEAAK